MTVYVLPLNEHVSEQDVDRQCVDAGFLGIFMLFTTRRNADCSSGGCFGGVCVSVWIWDFCVCLIF